jgi:hypothetical protein
MVLEHEIGEQNATEHEIHAIQGWSLASFNGHGHVLDYGSDQVLSQLR